MLGALTAAAPQFVPDLPRKVAVPLAAGAWVNANAFGVLAFRPSSSTIVIYKAGVSASFISATLGLHRPGGRRLEALARPAMSAHPAVASPGSAARAAMLWGVLVGVLQAGTPLAFWWLDSSTVYALGLAVIAAIYIGFAVADGRPKVIAVESGVAFAFVVVAAAAVTGSPWLLVVGLAGHALKDLWQHRTQFVAGTRWWPPFCMAVDVVVAAVIAVEIAAGMHFG